MAPVRLADDFRRSARELKRVRSLAVLGMLTSLQVILGMLTIQIGSSVQITFDYLPLCAVSMLFGPVPAMLTGALSDLLAFLIRPTGAFNPGFTISAAVSGLLYSLFLYDQEPLKLWQLILARLIVVVVCNAVLNTAWLLLMYGAGAWAWIPGRLIKNAVEYPVSVALLWALHRLLIRIRKNIFTH